MKKKILMQFEDAADLEAHLKDHGYLEVFRRYKDGVILTNGGQYPILITGEGSAYPNKVAFAGCLEDVDLERPDEENSINPLYLEAYGSGGLFWYRLEEIAIEKTTDDEGIFKLLMDIGTFESEFID